MLLIEFTVYCFLFAVENIHVYRRWIHNRESFWQIFAHEYYESL